MSDQNGSPLGLGTVLDQTQYAYWIGQFVIKWTFLESMLLMPMSIGLNSKNQDAIYSILYSSNSTENRISIVKNVIKTSEFVDNKNKLLITKILNIIQNLCEKRNSIIHHTWVINLDSKTMHLLDKRNFDKFSREIKTEEIIELCNNVVDLCEKLCAATDSHFFDEEKANYMKEEMKIHCPT